MQQIGIIWRKSVVVLAMMRDNVGRVVDRVVAIFGSDAMFFFLLFDDFEVMVVRRGDLNNAVKKQKRYNDTFKLQQNTMPTKIILMIRSLNGH